MQGLNECPVEWSTLALAVALSLFCGSLFFPPCPRESQLAPAGPGHPGPTPAYTPAASPSRGGSDSRSPLTPRLSCRAPWAGGGEGLQAAIRVAARWAPVTEPFPAMASQRPVRPGEVTVARSPARPPSPRQRPRPQPPLRARPRPRPHAAGARQPHGQDRGLHQRARALRQDRRGLRNRAHRGEARGPQAPEAH